MPVPVVSRAIEGARGVYTPDDYGVLQLMAEVGESDADDLVAVGAYAFFQMYVGALGYWTYEGGTPFMGLSNLPPLIDFVRSFGWPEFEAELELVAGQLQPFSPEQVAAYEAMTIDSETHGILDAIAFRESLTRLMAEDHNAGGVKFRAASEYLEATVEFLLFDDGQSLREWRSHQG